jgi:hypothetical protein
MGVGATSVGPESRTMILTRCTLLKQHFTFLVENKDAESPVQQALPVGLHFFHGAYGTISFIYKYEIGENHMQVKDRRLLDSWIPQNFRF